MVHGRWLMAPMAPMAERSLSQAWAWEAAKGTRGAAGGGGPIMSLEPRVTNHSLQQSINKLIDLSIWIG